MITKHNKIKIQFNAIKKLKEGYVNASLDIHSNYKKSSYSFQS